MGWRYFDFGEDNVSKTFGIRIKVRGMGSRGRLRIFADSLDSEIGCAEFAEGDAVLSARVKALTGRHAVFMRAESGYEGWFADSMKGRQLIQLDEFVFIK